MSADPSPPDPVAPQPPVPPAAAEPAADVSVAAPTSTPANAAPRTHGDVHGAGSTHCLNCGTALQGPFCHACGQHDFDVNQSFWHTFLEALENLFHFEGKFFRNMVTLLFRPGVLTAEFNAGKRAAQMPPFRLYVFTAFVFFLWIFSRQGDISAIEIGDRPAPRHGVQVDGRPAPVGEAAESVHSAATPASAGSETPRTVDRVRQFAEEQAPVATPERNRPRVNFVPIDKPEAQKSDFERWVEHQARRSTEPGFQREMAHVFLAAVPKLLLICLPLFALYSRFFHRRSGKGYLQHLVLAVHFHTFIYLWIMFRDGWSFALALPGGPVGRWVELACNAWLALYPVLMFRRLFGGGWIGTGLKTVAIALLYMMTLAVVFFGSFIVLVLFL